MRTVTLVAGTLIAALPLVAASAPAAGGASKPAHSAAAKRGRGHWKTATAPTTCSSNASSGYGYFIGIPGNNDVAGGGLSSIVAGSYNEACDFGSIVGGGSYNIIGDNGNAQSSFIGAGSRNGVTGIEAFVGAGAYNSSDSFYSFVGAGENNSAAGAGAFVGGGGSVYTVRSPGGSGVPPGNLATGADSFVGSGDLNQISGNGSFIGGGGYIYANGGATMAGNTISGSDSFVGAGDQNTVSADDSFIGGGTGSAVATGATYGAIGGGYINGVSSPYGAILGGHSNSVYPSGNASGQYGLIGGGLDNVVNGAYGSIVGGSSNIVSGEYGTVGGGSGSIASGVASTVPGGYHNLASGNFSFAAGVGSYASTVGSFVWSDDATGAKHLAASKPNEFLARASGGFTFYTNAAASTGAKLPAGSGAWSSSSDRNLKSDVATIDDSRILAKVAALPVAEWSYTSERGVRHLGPMAQDFYAAFHVGEDDRHITAIDEDGVALAAIKALHAENVNLHAENVEKQLETLASEVARVVPGRTR